MTRRTVAALLFACGIAVAAPVPKAGPKLEDVFGEIVDKKSDCKFEMNKDGALAVTVPTTHPALETDAPITGRCAGGTDAGEAF